MNITITGGTGFLGKSLTSLCLENGHKVKSLSSSTDLRDYEVGKSALEDADVVIHLAGTIGGIGANQAFPGKFFYDNLIMGVNVVQACHELQIDKLVLAGTVCSYPVRPQAPFREEDLWNGFPEITNAPYGIAKRAIGEMCRAYHLQYGMKYIYLLPTNMFGLGDNYSEQHSHILPDTIRKISRAIKTGNTPVFWGTGTATREFLNVRDAARAFLLAAESDSVGGPFNIGSGQCFSIKETIEKVAKLMDYTGPIQWDSSKPDGQPHRFLDCSKAKAAINFKAEIPFEDGIKEMIKDFRERFPNG